MFKKEIRLVHLNAYFTSQTLRGKGSVFGVGGLVSVSVLLTTGSVTLTGCLAFSD